VPSLLRHRPELSIVVAAFDMARELPRTVYSLSSTYQRGIEGFDYEIVVVDNGSPVAVDAPRIEAIAPNVRVIRMEGLGVSPAKAINRAVDATSGRTVGIVLDGARMVTPGVVALARSSLEINQRALVTTMAWHLGPDLQTISQQSGYSASVEDQLLRSIGWPEDGYRLFEIAALAAANRQGWFGSMNESCCTFLTRESFIALGGYDESFVSPGGGYVNLDFFLRATQRPSGEVIVLLGEGSFHQIHGGVATNAADLDVADIRSRVRGPAGLPVCRSRDRPTVFGSTPSRRQALADRDAAIGPGARTIRRGARASCDEHGDPGAGGCVTGCGDGRGASSA
jgi:hypothetical protein